jgi:hypothetical protein
VKEKKKKNDYKSPFMDKRLLITRINKFLEKNNSKIWSTSNAINSFFEMNVYNDIIKFYENESYEVKIENLQNENEFKYKKGTNGKPENFSFFLVRKREITFEIRHNIPIQSSYRNKTFLTPDISVISQNQIKSNPEPHYYQGKRIFNYVENQNLHTFCEVKHYHPFPELLFNFIGLIYALKKDIFDKKESKKLPKHPAPILAISGKGNYHTRRIVHSIMNDFKVNIISELFYNKNQISKKNNKLVKIGTNVLQKGTSLNIDDKLI